LVDLLRFEVAEATVCLSSADLDLVHEPADELVESPVAGQAFQR
jgi:hypothetical protein